jgi:hypothetical protein
MPFLRTRRAVTCAVITSLALGGSAIAADAPDTTMSVSPRVTVAAPASSPVGFPGVSKVRKGETLPRNWAVVSRAVKITRGGEPAYAAMRMTCPKGKTWRSGASEGGIGVSVLDTTAAPGRKRSVLVMATFSTTDVRVGESASGTVYALCR